MTAHQPLTVLIARRVRPGREAEFEAIMDRMLDAAGRFPGHLGGYVVPPASGNLYHVLFAFDTDANRRAWMDSPERQAILEKVAEFSFGDDASHVLTGLETWFAVPAGRGRPPPPRHKMAVVTWCGIFPSVLLLSALLGPLLAPLPVALRTAVVTILVVVGMTWVVMPFLAGRVFARWLYPAPIR